MTETLVRFCPHCGLIGPPGDQYRDCCPDGSGARMVPEPFAQQCKDLFDLAIGRAGALRGAQEESGWRPISEAPQDSTPVDLWREGERLVNMCRVDLGNGNVFYAPVENGPSCVRNATHFQPLPSPPAPEGEAK